MVGYIRTLPAERDVDAHVTALLDEGRWQDAVDAADAAVGRPSAPDWLLSRYTGGTPAGTRPVPFAMHHVTSSQVKSDITTIVTVLKEHRIVIPCPFVESGSSETQRNTATFGSVLALPQALCGCVT